MIVSRTCTEISTEGVTRCQEAAPRPLEDFRDVPAYVLLGDAGAGKTIAFEAEDEALGDDAIKIEARDFLTFKPKDHPEWWDKTLYIDGLDEVRAGAANVLTPFDRIRKRLDTLRRPRFRLSCREADWLGDTDRARLESVSPNGKITILRLNPLEEEDIKEILKAQLGADKAEAFIAEANNRGIGDLLMNPETLDLLTKAVAGGGGHWPGSRTETFDMACKQMVCELNPQHVAARASSYSPEPPQLLDAAGRICAVQLIAGVLDTRVPTDSLTRTTPPWPRSAMTATLPDCSMPHLPPDCSPKPITASVRFIDKSQSFLAPDIWPSSLVAAFPFDVSSP